MLRELVSSSFSSGGTTTYTLSSRPAPTKLKAARVDEQHVVSTNTEQVRSIAPSRVQYYMNTNFTELTL